MKILERVLKTAHEIRLSDKNNGGCVPDYVIVELAKRYNLVVEDVRDIRDVIQANRTFFC